MSKRYVILLTACVNPKNMSYTYLMNEDVRRQQYRVALDFYLQNTLLPIVFCENTQCDFSGTFQNYIDVKRLEYLTFDGNNFDKSRGKGYGETEIMEYALIHSRFFQCADIVIKITGRLQLRNIESMLKINRLIMSSVIQTNCINVKSRMMDSRVIFAPVDFLKNDLIVRKEMLNDSKEIYFEHILYLSICEQKHFLYFPFVIAPDIVGISGTTGIDYTHLINFREYLSYAFYSLGNGLQLSRRNMKMRYSCLLVCFIQIMRCVLKLLYLILSFQYRSIK